MRQAASWLIGLLVLGAQPASALTLTPLGDGRGLNPSCAATCSVVISPDVPFGPWSASVGGTSQVSAISDLGMSGSGVASSSDIDDPSWSMFLVIFSIDETATFSLRGSISAGGAEEHTGRVSSAGVYLMDEAGTMDEAAWSVGSSASGATQPFDVLGVLAPGTYTMWASASAVGVGAEWDFALALAPVPEPGATLLAAAALVGLALRRVR